MFSTAVLAVVAVCCLQAEASLFRIFLVDGESLVSYGEFARVADKVVFSVPLGDAAAPTLQTVTFPSSAVDWERTEDYATAVRARRYAETRGEDDFTLLASRVTQALNDINLAPDPKRRLAMAEEARGNLAAWPAANYGYRAADVARLVGLLDDVVTEMRAAAGEQAFALNFVATTIPPPPPELLPAPDAHGIVESAVRAAEASAEPTERIEILRAASASLAALPGSPATSALRARIESALGAELKIEGSYNELTRAALKDAQQRAAGGDARGLQQVIARALAADDRLGRRRPGAMSALLAVLDAKLEEAHRVRVARDAWIERVAVFRVYSDATRSARNRMNDLTRGLKRIRDHKADSPRALQQIEIRATMAIHELRLAQVPPELAGVHNLSITALQLARQAASLRRDAVSSKHTRLAWDASSAAAGALMLHERATGELNRLISDTAPLPR